MTDEGFVSLKDIMLEKNLYRSVTKVLHTGGSEGTLSKLLNEMLEEYLHTYVLSKRMGHMLISKDIVKIAFDSLSEEQIMKASIANAVRYKDGALLEHGRLSLRAYLQLIRSFAKANKFEFEINKNSETDNHVLVISFGACGANFTRFKAETYRILLEEFAELTNIVVTNSAAYFEFKPRKEEPTRQPITK